MCEKHHQENQIIGDVDVGIQTQRIMTISPGKYILAFLSKIEPKDFAQSSKDQHWVNYMEEELNQIDKNGTWKLVPQWKDKNEVGREWVFKDKINEEGKIIINKAIIVCKCCAQVEGLTLKKLLLIFLD